MVDHGEREVLESQKAQSVSQVLFKCARLLNEQALVRVRARTGLPIRAAHTSLFPHVDLEGTRLTELARRLGISKQAVGQLVDELEVMGVVERVPDPADGRAKLVRFAQRNGEHWITTGLALLGEVEVELAQALPPGDLETLHAILTRMLQVLQRTGPPGEPEE